MFIVLITKSERDNKALIVYLLLEKNWIGHKFGGSGSLVVREVGLGLKDLGSFYDKLAKLNLFKISKETLPYWQHTPVANRDTF